MEAASPGGRTSAGLCLDCLCLSSLRTEEGHIIEITKSHVTLSEAKSLHIVKEMLRRYAAQHDITLQQEIE